MNSSDIKPGRPVGLTLAILLSVLLYAVMPLTLLGYRLLVQDRLSRIDTPVEVNYYRNGGILQTALRRMANKSQ